MLRFFEEILLNFGAIHQCHHFAHDGVSTHKTKIVATFPNDLNTNILQLQCNSSDFTRIRNAWNFIKNKVHDTSPSNINDLKEALKTLHVLLNPCQNN